MFLKTLNTVLLLAVTAIGIAMAIPITVTQLKSKYFFISIYGSRSYRLIRNAFCISVSYNRYKFICFDSAADSVADSVADSAVGSAAVGSAGYSADCSAGFADCYDCSLKSPHFHLVLFTKFKKFIHSEGISLVLPENYKKDIREILKNYDDGEEYFGILSKPPFRAVRLNTLKCSREQFLKRDFLKGQSPFCKESFYISSDFAAGSDPYHHAGAFYVQEPSAATAVEVLDPKPGDYVLDLCAAPGGKSTQIAAKLSGEGLIWSNDAVFRRAQIIVSNFERMGIANGVVSAAMPDALAKELEGVFDKVLVDAPCSGEGMFRKEPQAVEMWSRENVAMCAERQREILNRAAVLLRDGGTLVYSTCTFSYEENEQNVLWFLKEHSDFEAVPIEVGFGRAAVGLQNAVRVFPMDGGEGHFVAKFKKRGNSLRNEIPFLKSEPQKAAVAALKSFCDDSGIKLPDGNLIKGADGGLYLSKLGALPKGLCVLRQGLPLGSERKGRLLPSHAMFSSPAVTVQNELSLELSDKRTAAFLHGEETEAEGITKNGYLRVSVDGIPLSFGKAVGGRVKNGYPKGLRTL